MKKSIDSSIEIESDNSKTDMIAVPNDKINASTQRFPHCIVWCPIPLITLLF